MEQPVLKVMEEISALADVKAAVCADADGLCLTSHGFSNSVMLLPANNHPLGLRAVVELKFLYKAFIYAKHV
jgi:hypothetical protein